MSRPPKCRKIAFLPHIVYFKPAGIPARELEEVTLSLDEVEAVRLADLEGLYQEDAAAGMNVSRQTFANILTSAHRKIAETLIFGKALRIEGGTIELRNRQFICHECTNRWNIPLSAGLPSQCPRCKAANIHPSGKECPAGAGKGKRCRRKNLAEEDQTGGK